MAEAGIPDAGHIVHSLEQKSGAGMSGIEDPGVILGNALVVEAKYRTMCRLIEESGCRTNVDLPCGYTPKALHMTRKGMQFIGLDLPIVAGEAGPILLSLAEHPERMRFSGVDATNYDSLAAALEGVDGPICISTEGMMMYFTESEVFTVLTNIHGLLEEHGGCWITPDPEFILQFYLTFRSVLGKDAVEKLAASRNSAEGASDVGNLTNSFIADPMDVENSLQTVKAFLHRHNMRAERVNLGEAMPELTMYGKLTGEQIAEFRMAMSRCHYWVIRLAEDLYEDDKPQKDSPFEMDCALVDGTFRVSLRGRVDTITAPELLKAWETEKAANTIQAAEMDCSGLQYISSAGLRVLMMIQKGLPGAPVKLTGVNDAVWEILETTGFIDIFEIERQAVK
ncbi:MAG: STAS domain-containing protein [Eubacteriales bacterium]|nr:STAS domain-containing protein [Eubacteriales bacterium]